MHIVSTSRCVVAALIVTVLGAGCTLPLSVRGANIRILTYNVQNLFDDHAGGNEYEEFDPDRSSWSTAEYYRRLQDISRVIRDSVKGGPDIVALQEIEHAGVLEDLRERYLAGLGYSSFYATEQDTSPIVVGVLARVPVTGVWTHGARIDSSVAIRPVLEVAFEIHGTPLHLFVCHWKSKSGGAEATEPYRIAAASALRTIIEERLAEDSSLDIVVVGDLNERPEEFSLTGRNYDTALFPAGEEDVAHGPVPGLLLASIPQQRAVLTEVSRDKLVLYSPWTEATSPGSYWFRGVWERIDHVLLSASCFDAQGFNFEQFVVFAPEYALNAEGAPLRYSLRSGRGFSDHLPLVLTLKASR